MDNRKLAKKGRHGDTHIRDVYGIKSHVNKLEADIIDSYGLLGESFVGATGSGTINPETGLSEYNYQFLNLTHNAKHAYDLAAGTDTAHPKKKEQPTTPSSTPPTADDDPYGLTGEGEVLLQAERGSDFGMEDLSPEDFSKMNPSQLVDWIIKTKFPLKAEDEDFKKWLAERLNTAMPQLQQASEEEKGFITTQYGGEFDPTTGDYTGAEFGPGPDGIYGTEDDPGGTAGRTAGITYGAAGRTYETAGIQKETMLGGLQESAYQVGAPTTGRDLRGAISGKQKIKKGFETGMDIYDIAGRTYGAAGEVYGLAETTAGLGGEKASYLLGKGLESDWDRDWSSFLSTLDTAG